MPLRFALHVGATPRFNKNQASNDSLIVAATDILQKPDGKYFDFDDGGRCSACHIEAISKQKNSLEPQILINSDWCMLRDSTGSIVQLELGRDRQSLAAFSHAIGSSISRLLATDGVWIDVIPWSANRRSREQMPLTYPRPLLEPYRESKATPQICAAT